MEVNKRYDFVFFFDVKDGNPNGDPDAGNLPRVDAETGDGLVTDVCLKRKVRNYIQLRKREEMGFRVWVKEKAILNTQIEEAYETSVEVKDALSSWQLYQKDKKKNPKPTRHYEDVAKDWMCHNFYDIRAFGAVMSTSDKPEGNAETASKIKKTAGQVRGPVQITFARSVDQVVALEHTIAVIAARKADKPIEEQIGLQGRKFTVPYGLYRTYGFISAPLAKQTGFSQEDLALFWEALQNMFEHDRSAARGLMSARRLVIFEHSSSMGNKSAQDLFDRVKSERRAEKSKAPRDFSDYKITLDGEELKEFKTVVQV